MTLLDPSLPPAGTSLESLWRRVASLERQVEAMEKQGSVIIFGTRSDLAAGVGPRVQMGVLTDGTFGIERWTSAGVRTVGTFT